MLLRCGLHAPMRKQLAKVCDNILSSSWSEAPGDKERYQMLLKDARVQQPMNAFLKKCIRERDTAVILPGAESSEAVNGGVSVAPLGRW